MGCWYQTWVSFAQTPSLLCYCLGPPFAYFFLPAHLHWQLISMFRSQHALLSRLASFSVPSGKSELLTFLAPCP